MGATALVPGQVGFGVDAPVRGRRDVGEPRHVGCRCRHRRESQGTETVGIEADGHRSAVPPGPVRRRHLAGGPDRQVAERPADRAGDLLGGAEGADLAPAGHCRPPGRLHPAEVVGDPHHAVPGGDDRLIGEHGKRRLVGERRPAIGRDGEVGVDASGGAQVGDEEVAEAVEGDRGVAPSRRQAVGRDAGGHAGMGPGGASIRRSGADEVAGLITTQHEHALGVGGVDGRRSLELVPRRLGEVHRGTHGNRRRSSGGTRPNRHGAEHRGQDGRRHRQRRQDPDRPAPPSVGSPGQGAFPIGATHVPPSSRGQPAERWPQRCPLGVNDCGRPALRRVHPDVAVGPPPARQGKAQSDATTSPSWCPSREIAPPHDRAIPPRSVTSDAGGTVTATGSP